MNKRDLFLILLSFLTLDITNAMDRGAKQAQQFYNATSEGKPKAVRKLFKQKFNVGHTYPDGKSTLHIACQFGERQIVKKILKENKELVHTKDILGNTPLHTLSECKTASENYENIAKALIDNAARLDTTNNQEMTPAQYAILMGCDHLAKYLMKNVKNRQNIKY